MPREERSFLWVGEEGGGRVMPSPIHCHCHKEILGKSFLIREVEKGRVGSEGRWSKVKMCDERTNCHAKKILQKYL